MFALRSLPQNLARRLGASIPAGSYLSASTIPAQLDLKDIGVDGDEPQQFVDNPFQLVRPEIDVVSERIRRSIVSEIPALDKASEYFFKVGAEGKRLRPSMILLLASAISQDPPPMDRTRVDLRPPNAHVPEIYRRQQRIAEIAEIIHVASLLHDDVIDSAATRRGVESLNVLVGNKLAVLAGDFLLARVSVTLAALRDSEVIEIISNILENLVTGEIMQMTSAPDALLTMDHYLSKTYRKTAALMSNSARSVALIAGQPQEVCQAASDYGQHLGMAFQLVDDILDFTGDQDELGKPSLNDLKSGIATAPVLLALEEFPGLKPLVLRKFQDSGDVDEAVRMVRKSNGIQKAIDLAEKHSKIAEQAVQNLPAPKSSFAEACWKSLLQLPELILKRSK